MDVLAEQRMVATFPCGVPVRLRVGRPGTRPGFVDFVRMAGFAGIPLAIRRASCIIELVQHSKPGGKKGGRTPVNLHISSSDGVPIYQQIVNQVKYLVASGRLAAGEEMPPIRVLAERLLVNPNTVARAYRELETAGLVVKRRTAGTFVSDAGSPLARRERLKILAARIDALLAEAKQLNVGVDEVVQIVHQRDEAMQRSAHAEEK